VRNYLEACAASRLVVAGRAGFKRKVRKPASRGSDTVAPPHRRFVWARTNARHVLRSASSQESHLVRNRRQTADIFRRRDRFAGSLWDILPGVALVVELGRSGAGGPGTGGAIICPLEGHAIAFLLRRLVLCGRSGQRSAESGGERSRQRQGLRYSGILVAAGISGPCILVNSAAGG